MIVPDRATFMDQQVLKLQEMPESVPTGEMPRSLDLVLDRLVQRVKLWSNFVTDKDHHRNLVERVVPGTRVSVTGVVTVFRTAPSSEIGAAHIQRTYIQV